MKTIDEFQAWTQQEFRAETAVRQVRCLYCDGSGQPGQLNIGEGGEDEYCECPKCHGAAMVDERPADFVDAVIGGSDRDITARANALEVALILVLEQCDENAGGADDELRKLVLDGFKWASEAAERDQHRMSWTEQFELQDSIAMSGNC